jgi:hypothetical protein
MKMIGHQAIGMRQKAGLLAGLGQGLEKILPVHVVEENWFPAIPAAHDMVDRSGIFNAQLARHGAIFTKPLADVNGKMNRAMA